MLEETKSPQTKEPTIHHILAHSYFTYFLGLILGLLIHLYYPVQFLPKSMSVIGLPLIVLASLLVLWAQRTSGSLRRKKEPLTYDDFKKGPYAFSRRPTNLGLFVLVVGLGFMLNSLPVVAVTAVAMLITHYVFLTREERMLEKNYGEMYVKYKKSVRPWI